MIPNETIPNKNAGIGTGTGDPARAAFTAFAAWQESADGLWVRRERLRAQGCGDPTEDDTYLTAWCEHYDRFPTPPAYPGRLADSLRSTFA